MPNPENRPLFYYFSISRLCPKPGDRVGEFRPEDVCLRDMRSCVWCCLHLISLWSRSSLSPSVGGGGGRAGGRGLPMPMDESRVATCCRTLARAVSPRGQRLVEGKRHFTDLGGAGRRRRQDHSVFWCPHMPWQQTASLRLRATNK